MSCYTHKMDRIVTIDSVTSHHPVYSPNQLSPWWQQNACFRVSDSSADHAATLNSGFNCQHGVGASE